MNELSAKFEESGANIEKRGTVPLATVEGDVHDIGKNLVGMIMGASGYSIIDAGKDVANNKLVEMVKERNPQIVGLSSLLATTMPAQKEFIELAKECGILKNSAIRRARTRPREQRPFFDSFIIPVFSQSRRGKLYHFCLLSETVIVLLFRRRIAGRFRYIFKDIALPVCLPLILKRGTGPPAAHKHVCAAA